jgi:hypothetical protein
MLWNSLVAILGGLRLNLDSEIFDLIKILAQIRNKFSKLTKK